MSRHTKKNIDFLSRLSRVKQIFSSTRKSSRPGRGSVSEEEMMDSLQPTKPQRKNGKSKSLGAESSKNLENLDASTEKLPEVHRQSKSNVRQSTLDVPSGSGGALSRQQTASHLAELAQLTIQNERLLRENQTLRQQYRELFEGETAGYAQTSPKTLQVRYNQGERVQGGETLESLLLDRELLENLVWRLNVELGRCETRLLQSEKKSDAPGTRGTPSGRAPAWCRADPATLAPLLNAYDEALLEKEQLVEAFEQKLHGLSAEVRELVAENERLHEALEETQKKEAEAHEEQTMLQRDVDSLHSENVVLLEKLELEKTKNEDLADEYASKKSVMQEQDAMVAHKEAELKILAREYGLLEEKYAQMSIEFEQRIPAKHHNDAIADCRQLLEQLRQSYYEDRRLLEERNKALLVEKVAAETQARSLNAECAQAEARIKALEKLLRRTEARSEQLQTRLVGAESCRDSSVRELRQLMAVAERLTADQETLLQQLQSHQGTNRRLSVLRSSLKSVQKELPEIERQLRAQESGVERLKGDHQREMVKLRTLLRHKDHAIKQLQQERNSTCEQLEMVWKATGFESLTTAADKDSGNYQPASLPETHRKLSPT